MEQHPPTNPIHRALWAMGFDLDERNTIIRVATDVYPHDAIALGNFIANANAGRICNLALQCPQFPLDNADEKEQ